MTFVRAMALSQVSRQMTHWLLPSSAATLMKSDISCMKSTELSLCRSSTFRCFRLATLPHSGEGYLSMLCLSSSNCSPTNCDQVEIFDGIGPKNRTDATSHGRKPTAAGQLRLQSEENRMLKSTYEQKIQGSFVQDLLEE